MMVNDWILFVLVFISVCGTGITFNGKIKFDRPRFVFIFKPITDFIVYIRGGSDFDMEMLWRYRKEPKFLMRYIAGPPEVPLSEVEKFARWAWTNTAGVLLLGVVIRLLGLF